ncbi:MAG: hypothetical protein H6Q72_2696 [Firmicutes bacterium]|nr:hypothetical protein [Bacillota bacterium]
MKSRYPLAILNGAIITADGEYSCQTISLAEAKKLVQSAPGIISAVGHQATAEIISDLLGIKVDFNRINFHQNTGQQALVFKLNSRPPEGIILSRDEIEAFGFQFQLLSRHT